MEDAYSVIANYHNVNKAIALNTITTKSASVGVFWAGAIPYYTDREAFDFLGKSDSLIANLPPDLSGSVSWNGMTSVPGHNKYDLEYSIKSLQPTYVQNFVWGKDNLTDWGKANYSKVKYKGIELFLMTASPQVLWDEIANNPK